MTGDVSAKLVTGCERRASTSAVAEMRSVAKKKTLDPNKRKGTLIRVSDELAEALREATGLERMTVAEFGDQHILPVVRKRYRDALIKKARSVEGGGA
jgi:hypothetical protein